jgi:hypothetical protein
MVFHHIKWMILAAVMIALVTCTREQDDPAFEAHYFDNESSEDRTESISYGTCFPFLKPNVHLQFLYFSRAVICSNYQDDACQALSTIAPRFQSAGTHIPVGTSGSLRCVLARKH